VHTSRAFVPFLLLAITACAGQQTPSTTADLVDNPADQARPGDAVVTLVEPGSEPRALLRYRVTPGWAANAVTKMTMSLASSMGGGPGKEVKTPPIELVSAMSAANAPTPDGVSISSKVTAVAVKAGAGDNPDLVKQLEAAMGGMVGISAETTLSPRGFSRNFSLRLPQNPSPQVAAMEPMMRSAFQHALNAWPKEPIGAGGKWRVEADLDFGMMKIKQVGLLTLISRQGDHVVLDIEIEQSAPPQPFKAAGLSPGASITLKSYQGKAQGRTDLMLTTALPRMHMTMSSKADMSMVSQGRPLEIGTTTKMDMAMAPQ
jgi:hypothetical protein